MQDNTLSLTTYLLYTRYWMESRFNWIENLYKLHLFDVIFIWENSVSTIYLSSLLTPFTNFYFSWSAWRWPCLLPPLASSSSPYYSCGSQASSWDWKLVSTRLFISGDTCSSGYTFLKTGVRGPNPGHSAQNDWIMINKQRRPRTHFPLQLPLDYICSPVFPNEISAFGFSTYTVVP